MWPDLTTFEGSWQQTRAYSSSKRYQIIFIGFLRSLKTLFDFIQCSYSRAVELRHPLTHDSDVCIFTFTKNVSICFIVRERKEVNVFCRKFILIIDSVICKGHFSACLQSDLFSHFKVITKTRWVTFLWAHYLSIPQPQIVAKIFDRTDFDYFDWLFNQTTS